MPHKTKQEVIEALESFAGNLELSPEKIRSSLEDFAEHLHTLWKRKGGEEADRVAAAKAEMMAAEGEKNNKPGGNDNEKSDGVAGEG